MKQLIPFVKEIVFKTNIGTITSISLDHEEKVMENEVSGDFIIYGDYKIHNDTTEKELFKYRLPFTTILPDDIVKDTVKVDIEDFTYDIIDDDVLKVMIDFSIEGDFLTRSDIEENDKSVIDSNIISDNSIDVDSLKEIEDYIDKSINDSVVDKSSNDNKEIIIDNNEIEGDNNIIENNENEYITYNIHIVKDNETLEDIIKKYNTNIDNIKTYNDITNINIGDKIIIPEEIDE